MCKNSQLELSTLPAKPSSSRLSRKEDSKTENCNEKVVQANSEKKIVANNKENQSKSDKDITVEANAIDLQK